MLNPENYDPMKDPLARGRKPSRVEAHPHYRGGEVYSITFEDKGDRHICYGVTPQGKVMDACVLHSMLFVDGELEGGDISTMRFMLDSMEMEETKSSDGVEKES